MNKHETHFMNLLSRLDYDGFYSNYFKLNKDSNSFMSQYNNYLYK